MALTRASIKQILRFGIVGISNTMIDALVYVALRHESAFFEKHFLFASLIAFCVATLNSFFWNKHWTFKHKSLYSHKQLAGFYFLSSVALCVNQITLYVVTKLIIPGLPAKLIASATTSIVSFIMQKRTIFKTHKSVVA
ncbi:MAG: GtrA family protein [Candidatus Kerfeldbacteria bacterium]|nr:GtrA family protein [Candidatus Kerfeldbacteria bacterium]